METETHLSLGSFQQHRDSPTLLTLGFHGRGCAKLTEEAAAWEPVTFSGG